MSDNLKKTLLKCLNKTQNTKDEIRIVRLCHSFAYSYLISKAAKGKLYIDRNISFENFAYDYIGELFAKNGNGDFILLRKCFSVEEIKKMNSCEVELILKKIVFTHVEDNIFREMGRQDPSLRKIIRNIKLAIKSKEKESDVRLINGYLKLEEEFEEQNLQEMPIEIMQFKLRAEIEENMQIPDIVSSVINILENQNIFYKKYSVVGLAICIRKIHANFYTTRDESEKTSSINDLLFEQEFEDFLSNSIEGVKNTIGKKYVLDGKVSEDKMRVYLKACKKIVRESFNLTKYGYSQYEYLKRTDPQIEYSEFRTNDRQKLEYLVKKVKQQLIRKYKNEWIF